MFEAVKSAIAAAETAENDFESKSAANDTAQKALASAQQTAEAATSDLTTSKGALTTSLDGLKKAISDFEASLTT